MIEAPYYIEIMGARKKTGAGKWFLFWLVFFIGITLLFMLNTERIKGTLKEIRVLERLGRSGTTPAENDTSPELDLHIRELADTGQNTAGVQTGNNGAISSGNAAEIRQNELKPPKPPSPDNNVERSVFLMKVDSAGTILWTPVKREIPASNSPLQDAMEELIRGPSAMEEKQGLITLIPANTKILNTFVRGNTAYISFNEDFLFNTYGVEGYAGQRKQIVLTATEFSNVKDVQILIDGKPVEYLGENIWIGSPISRNML